LHPVDASETTASVASDGATSPDSDVAKPYDVRVLEANGHAKKREVWIGATNRVSAEVLSGLVPGDIVVIGPQSGDADGGTASGDKSSGHTGIGRLL
jgi:macrolide-specific efflux system membrane fusion protein